MLHANYQFCLENCLSFVPHKGRALDYGCGKGLLIEEGTRDGYDIYGVELFGAGGGKTIKDSLIDKGLYGSRVRELTNNRFPFEDGHFDFVVANMVFEHVHDLNRVLAEIERVLKKDGKALFMFPYKETCREGHALAV